MKNSKELKKYLQQIDNQSEDISPIHQMAALNNVLKQANIEELLDAANKKLALKIWNEIKEYGVQLDMPPILS